MSCGPRSRQERAPAHRYGVALATLLSAAALLATAPPSPEAVRLTVSGAIGPATSDYVERGIRMAFEHGAGLVILKLDTPGGLDSAMRDIIRAILSSPLPVVVYVAPSGARAASAGTYILYASHIAAMAPATNLGAATPVPLGGLPDLTPRQPLEEPGTEDEGGEAPAQDKPALPDTMSKKAINDAVAYIRALAAMRGRNADWAELAVREAASLAADDALTAGVIDLVAADERTLLRAIAGRVVGLQGRDVTLQTADMTIVDIEPDWRNELLSVITNPNIAYILMLLGIYGLFFEMMSPGYVLPGVVGAICLLVSLYALQVLPVNYAGLALLLLGIAFMVAELFAPSFGALGFGGVVAFAVGSVMLFDREVGNYQVSMSIIVALTALTAVFFLIAVRAVMKAHKGPVVSGREQLIGSIGEVLEDFEHSGRLRVHGELWSARARAPMRGGTKARVVGIDGLILEVEPVEEGDG